MFKGICKLVEILIAGSHTLAGGVLGNSSDGDDQRIFWGLKFFDLGTFGLGKFGKYFFFGGLISAGTFRGS